MSISLYFLFLQLPKLTTFLQIVVHVGVGIGTAVSRLVVHIDHFHNIMVADLFVLLYVH